MDKRQKGLQTVEKGLDPPAKTFYQYKAKLSWNKGQRLTQNLATLQIPEQTEDRKEGRSNTKKSSPLKDNQAQRVRLRWEKYQKDGKHFPKYDFAPISKMQKQSTAERALETLLWYRTLKQQLPPRLGPAEGTCLQAYNLNLSLWTYIVQEEKPFPQAILTFTCNL